MNKKELTLINLCQKLNWNCSKNVENFAKAKGEKCSNGADCASGKCVGGNSCKSGFNDPNCAKCQPSSKTYAGTCYYCNNGYYRDGSTGWVCKKKQDDSTSDMAEWGKKCTQNSECTSNNCLGGYCCKKSLSAKDSAGNFTHPKLKNCVRCRESSNKGGRGSCANCAAGFERGSHTGWKCKAIPGYVAPDSSQDMVIDSSGQQELQTAGSTVGATVGSTVGATVGATVREK